jgi:hypothetical protein
MPEDPGSGFTAYAAVMYDTLPPQSISSWSVGPTWEDSVSC